MQPEITENYALYHGDCCELLLQVPGQSVHLSVYSPPFCGLYHYSSSERDLSNCRNRDEFFEHYEFVVREMARVLMPGRITAVHCAEIPDGSAARYDLPGEIIRLHQRFGFRFIGRHCVWKEPLGVRMRTMAKGLAHRQVVEDSSLCDLAAADYLLLFRAPGTNPVPIEHPRGLLEYVGARRVPADLLQYRGWEGHHTENSYSHWIWRQYASAFWDDVRIDRVVPFEESRDPDDEKHVHPLQLDVIERVVVLRSNPGETVLTPFMGVGSEIYGALLNGRGGVGFELKESYFKQAIKNVQVALREREREQIPLLTAPNEDEDEGDSMEEVKTRTLVRNTWKPTRR